MTKEDVNRWIEKIEQISGVSDKIGDRATTQAGDRYVEICWDIFGEPFKKSDDPLYPLHLPSEAIAWSIWSVAFWTYWVQRQGKIHWRVRPECFASECGWRAYGRVFIEQRGLLVAQVQPPSCR